MTEVISVRFRGGCKNYYFDPKGHTVKMGDQVIVETAQGPEFGTCTQGNHEVPDESVVQPLCAMLRPATDADRRTVDYNRRKESEAFDICEKKIAEHGLEMKLVNVSASFDGTKIIFFFTADGRVDFRELVRDLAGIFRARIELRQIGVRDEAKMVGGLGICGRPFCCSQFLDGFLPVSIKMAKTQNLSLNPTKISGTCGRLMCCLKYEQNAYEDAQKRMPRQESFVQTPDGPGNVKSVDLLRETVKVSLDNAPEQPKCYHNCEICVLRNGKGSREGIEIPAERPARYVEETVDELAVPVISRRYEPEAPQDVPTPEPTRTESGQGKNRRRHRGGRRRSGGAGTPNPAAPVKKEAPEQAGAGQRKDDKGEKSEKPAGRPPRPQRPKSDRPRPERPRQEMRPPKAEAAPAPVREKEGTAEGGDAARRRRHRGGRRRRGGGSGGGTPAAE